MATGGGTATFSATVVDAEASCFEGSKAGYLTFRINTVRTNCLQSHARAAFVAGAEVALMSLSAAGGLKTGDKIAVSCAAEVACRMSTDAGPPAGSEMACRKFRNGCRNYCYASEVSRL